MDGNAGGLVSGSCWYRSLLQKGFRKSSGDGNGVHDPRFYLHNRLLRWHISLHRRCVGPQHCGIICLINDAECSAEKNSQINRNQFKENVSSDRRQSDKSKLETVKQIT